MNDPQHPALQFVAVLKDLAEGRLEPSDWLTWWSNHSAEVEAACPRGWFLKLKPSQLESGPNRAASISQVGAFAVLEGLDQPFVRSDRYDVAWSEDFRRFREGLALRKKQLADQFAPRLSALASVFPKFARFLRTRIDDIDEMEGGASEPEILELEESIGAPLPEAYKQFLRCTRLLALDGLSFGMRETCRHPAFIEGQQNEAGTICIAEFALEADGDQVLIECCAVPTDDPAVYYYAHSRGVNAARKLDTSISAWIETLPKSSVFR
jgi:hypothetical protein